MVYITLLPHDFGVFVSEESFDLDVEFFLIIREFTDVRRQHASRRRRCFDAENIVKFFQFTLENQVVGFVSANGSDNVFFRCIGMEVVQHGTHGPTLIRMLPRLEHNIDECFADDIQKSKDADCL